MIVRFVVSQRSVIFVSTYCFFLVQFHHTAAECWDHFFAIFQTAMPLSSTMLNILDPVIMLIIIYSKNSTSIYQYINLYIEELISPHLTH